MHIATKDISAAVDTPCEAAEKAEEAAFSRESNAEVLAREDAVGILVDDPVYRRLLESACGQLDLQTIDLDSRRLDALDLSRFELIVADEALACQVRALVVQREEQGDLTNPAVIALLPELEQLPHATPILLAEHSGALDEGLRMPMQPAQISARLSLILYAHRAFARRYQSTLDELDLNRRIFRSVTTGISVSNATQPDFPLVYVNPAFEVMTGYALEEVLGKNCRFLQGEEHDQAGIAVIRQALADKGETTVLIKNFRKDGSGFWNEFSLSPIFNREGKVTHFVGIQSDVTARVEFEAALRESEKLAAVGRLASSIAHEINNPLESVMNLLYLAQQTSDPAEVQEYVLQADREIRRVSLITSQSLRFYRQSSRPQPTGCTALLGSVLDLYESRVMNSRVVVERRERSTENVLCLESEIRQVLNNLVRNAIDAMGGTGGRLLIRTRAATDWHTGVQGIVMTVADTGTGISQQTMRQLYRPFFTTKGAAGTGLGLWISSEIVGRHHGHIRVRSSQRPQKSGTVFQMFLPSRREPVASENPR